MASQDQRIEGSQIENSPVQLVQAGQDAVSFQNSHDNQVTINTVILRLFGHAIPPPVDWEWAHRLLEKKQLPEIRKRLTDTLGRDRALMQVPLEEQLSAVGRSPLEAERRLQVQGEDLGTIDWQQLLIATFGREDIAGRLLILGTPGAGKTTALLSLAEQLVCGAIARPKTVIPVWFELSTWRDDNQSIRDWLVEQLYDLHGGDRKTKRYEQWLEQQVLLPLLDGLDELGLERQRKCTLKLNEFARQYPHLVVCCRVREFAQVNIKFNNLNGAVRLEPLSDDQIQTYLVAIGRAPLWPVIQSTPSLRYLLESTAEGDPGLLRVPLFLTLAATAYDAQSPFQTKTELLQCYVERQLSRDIRESDRRKEVKRRQWAYPTPDQEPAWRETQQTLIWLARQLQQTNRVELLIEQIQPRWLETQQARQRYRLIVGLSVGLSVGLMGGLIYGLIVGLISGLMGALDSIQLVEAFKISMSPHGRRKILASLKAKLKQGLIVGLMGGLIVGLIVGLIYGLIYGLIVGLMAGLISGLIGGLKQDLQLRSRPNQGIWNSLQSFFWTTLFSYPLGFIFVFGTQELSTTVARDISQGNSGWMVLNSLSAALPRFLLPGLFGALLFGFLAGGGLACMQHFCLRLVLWQSGLVPWNLARFLNYCTERKLLQRVGGRYRFLHRELLDYFASLP